MVVKMIVQYKVGWGRLARTTVELDNFIMNDIQGNEEWYPMTSKITGLWK